MNNPEWVIRNGVKWHVLEVLWSGESVIEMVASAMIDGVGTIAKWQLNSDQEWEGTFLDFSHNFGNEVEDHPDTGELMPLVPPWEPGASGGLEMWTDATDAPQPDPEDPERQPLVLLGYPFRYEMLLLAVRDHEAPAETPFKIRAVVRDQRAGMRPEQMRQNIQWSGNFNPDSDGGERQAIEEVFRKVADKILSRQNSGT